MLAKLPLDYYNRKLDRMDPELARALREGQMSTAASFGLGSADELDHPPDFSNVSAALHETVDYLPHKCQGAKSILITALPD